jgi:hypothetical protein
MASEFPATVRTPKALANYLFNSRQNPLRVRKARQYILSARSVEDRRTPRRRFSGAALFFR